MPVRKHGHRGFAVTSWAAGIDVDSTSHFVAVPEGFNEKTVREFKSFTTDLNVLASWLKQCGIKTVDMESTGVYWIPVYELLEAQGFEVKLVDAKQVKNVSDRKTDVLDCQWIQQLHTYGLLNAAFRPAEDSCALRAYVRQRTMLIKSTTMHIQHMQKALTQMNIQLHHVLTDITGKTGMNSLTALYLIGEIGLGMTRWNSPKRFASWLGLCPGNKVSGGKRLSGKSKPSANRAAATLRMAASTLYRSSTALGAYLRRLKSRLGRAKAITATAHKISKIIYNMLRHGIGYNEAGQDYYEQKYQDQVLRNLKRKAEELGFSLVETAQLDK